MSDTATLVAPLDRPEVLERIFHPRATAGTGQETIPVADGVAVGTRFHLGEATWPTILFFHGNGETVADYDDIGPLFLEERINFVVTDYRGYGISGGTPTLAALYHDAHAVYRAVRQRFADDTPFFLMGRSLGSAPAIELAVAYQKACAGLIIDSGFGAAPPLLARLGVAAADLPAEAVAALSNLERISRVTIPTYMLHGQHDEIIPVGEAEELQASSGARAKQFVVVPGADHNTLMAVAGRRYFEAVRAFIDKTLGIRPRWQRKRS